MILTLARRLFAILSFKITRYIINPRLLKVTSFLLAMLFVLKTYIISFATFIML
jgi:hypothetical protein